MEPNRIEWQKRCTFNGFCKAVLRNEAIDAIRERKYRKKHEVTFSDLSPQEENQLYTCDKYFVNDEAEKSFFVAGKRCASAMFVTEPKGSTEMAWPSKSG